jgi:hypothetical protein
MRLHCLVVALALLAAFASDSWGQSQEPPRQDGNPAQHDVRPEDQKTQNSPPAVKQTAPEQTKEKAESTESKGNYNWLDRWSLSDKIAVIASVVAFLQFLALISTVYVMRRTAQRQLRAYIVASAGEIQRIDGGFILSATLKNTGQTPAFNARIMAETFGDSYPLATEHPHPEPMEDFGVPLGSGEELHCAYRIFTVDPDDTWRRVQGGEVGLWIQGTVVYDDCFKERHKTKFRFVYGGRIAAATIHMHADRRGNIAD